MTHSAESRRGLIEQIARRARVSTSTVSRVLNGATRGAYPKSARRNAEIRRIADELHYRPTLRGRTFQGGRTRLVALLYGSASPMLGSMYGTVISSAIAALREVDYHLVPWGLSTADVQRTDLFLDRRFDGVLVHHTLTAAIREAIDRIDLPAVLVNNTDPAAPSVLPRDRAAAGALVQHLLEAGHRSIAYVTAEVDHVSGKARLAGYSAAMRRAGLKPQVVIMKFSDSHVAWPTVLAAGRPTAVIFLRCQHAAGSIQQWRKGGIAVPDDVSVAAFDNTEAAVYSTPPLTVMVPPFAEMGRRAAEMLIKRIEEPTARVGNLRIDARLIVRDSTARPHKTQSVNPGDFHSRNVPRRQRD